MPTPLDKSGEKIMVAWPHTVWIVCEYISSASYKDTENIHKINHIGKQPTVKKTKAPRNAPHSGFHCEMLPSCRSFKLDSKPTREQTVSSSGCMKNEKGHPLISVVKLLLMEGQTCGVVGSVQTSRKLRVIELLVLRKAGGGGHWPWCAVHSPTAKINQSSLKYCSKTCKGCCLFHRV